MTSPERGLQAERTALAWRRTGLAAGALAALLVHGGNLVTGLAVAACAVLFVLCGRSRYRFVLRAVSSGRTVVDGRLAAAAGVLAVLPGLLALAAVLGG